MHAPNLFVVVKNYLVQILKTEAVACHFRLHYDVDFVVDFVVDFADDFAALCLDRLVNMVSFKKPMFSWKNANNPAKKTRCSQVSTKKGFTLCFRHFKLQKEGRTVALE